MGCIYKITNSVNGKSYIGQTIQDVEKRVNDHLGMTRLGSRLISDAVQEYGRESFDYEILYDEISSELLNDFEKKAIREFNTIDPNGYNLTPGGEGGGKNLSRSKSEALPPSIPSPSLKLNHERFRKFCRTVPQSELQKATGLSRQTLYNRLVNPKTLTADNFFAICEVIDEPIETFLEESK